jgi:hypothetical protein
MPLRWRFAVASLRRYMVDVANDLPDFLSFRIPFHPVEKQTRKISEPVE